MRVSSRPLERRKLSRRGSSAAGVAGATSIASSSVEAMQEHAAGQRQNPRVRKPEPVLLIGGFQAAEETPFAGLGQAEAMAVLKESLALGDDSVVAADRTARGQRIRRAQPVGGTAGELARALAKPLVEVSGKQCRPAGAPLGAQADGLRLSATRVIEKIHVRADAEFVPGLPCKRSQPRTGLRISRIDREGGAEVLPRFLGAAQRAQQLCPPDEEVRPQGR